MSHMVDMNFNVTDLDSLAAAAATVGGVFHRDRLTHRWYGSFVGDAPLPAGFAVTDLGKCEHEIAIEGAPGAYSIGVVRRRDGKPGYTLLFDTWDKSLETKFGKNLNALRQAYSASVAQQAMVRKGYKVTLQKQANGKMTVVCTR